MDFLQRPPPAGGSAYPDPAKLRWDRPMYASEIAAEEESNAESEGDEWDDDFEDDFGGGGGGDPWCMDGMLFVGLGGASSSDVIQGKLGDCWFLGALSVLATREDLLRAVFWCEGKYSEWGIFVCRFMKDFVWHYVICDDRIPVYDTPSGDPVFARCRDPNELW